MNPIGQELEDSFIDPQEFKSFSKDYDKYIQKNLKVQRNFLHYLFAGLITIVMCIGYFVGIWKYYFQYYSLNVENAFTLEQSIINSLGLFFFVGAWSVLTIYIYKDINKGFPLSPRFILIFNGGYLGIIIIMGFIISFIDISKPLPIITSSTLVFSFFIVQFVIWLKNYSISPEGKILYVMKLLAVEENQYEIGQKITVLLDNWEKLFARANVIFKEKNELKIILTNKILHNDPKWLEFVKKSQEKEFFEKCLEDYEFTSYDIKEKDRKKREELEKKRNTILWKRNLNAERWLLIQLESQVDEIKWGYRKKIKWGPILGTIITMIAASVISKLMGV